MMMMMMMMMICMTFMNHCLPEASCTNPGRYTPILQTGAYAVVLALLVAAGDSPPSSILWPLAEDCPAVRFIITP